MSHDLTAVLDERDADAGQRGALARAYVERHAIEVTIFDEVASVEHEWRQLGDVADCTPFQTYEWQWAWWRHVGRRMNVQPVLVIGRSADGAPLFLFPLAVEPGAVRRLTWFGTDLCDYNGPLLGGEFSARMPVAAFPDLWRTICGLLQSRPSHRFDLVSLSKMPARVGSQDNPFMALGTAPNPSNAYMTDLHGSWDDYYQAKRSSATRRRDRTKLKRLAEFGEVRFVTPQDRAEILATLDTLMAQKARSFERMGVANMFMRPGWPEFFREVATDPDSRHFVHVSRLDAGPIWTATNFGLTFRDCYYHILASHDDGETARFGPGVAHLRELLRYAIDRGLHRFDFTIGDERYKREWSDRTVPLYDHLAAATVRGWPAAVLMHTARSAKRLIKQNEALWELFSRARSRLASRTAGGAADVRKSPPIAPE
jgi:CelD/BcsL family acetyltransferase involved in cellulose biosynthesis